MAREIKVKRKEVELPANPAQTFRQKMQNMLLQHEEKMLDSLSKLPPKDFLDIYVKLLPYGFSKVPEERPIEVPDNANAILEERQRKITLISGQRMDEAEVVEE
jgi:hypothetical protein